MKRKIMLITLILIFIFPLKAYASTASVEVNVDGNVKKGEEINILINMKGLESLYAASVNFTYDKSILNIVNITAGDSIKKYADEIMEIGGEVDTTNNKTSYSFTFLGDKDGINGDGTLAIIKAKILRDGVLSIDEDSIKIKLVKREADSVENYDYKFIGYNTEKDVSTENKEENDTNNKDENNTIDDENVSIPNTDNNIKDNNENNTKEEETSESIEDKVVIDNNTNKEENTFFENILNGNIVENIINNIKNFISGNSNEENLNKENSIKENNIKVDFNKEDINKENNLEENEKNNVDDKVNEDISKYDNTDSLDKNAEDKSLEEKEETSVGTQARNNIYIYFVGAIAIVAGIYVIYKLKNDKTK
ncbi:hypothetical protein H9660_10825 [Clostridium sp. Sa3CUN1]|uniref:Cohesin domain-containing protein n=1 Tax=Clostridium gallinarum TaxID=2762246 RepID=A0ABR8Q5D1_9CLOT|nr:cohesin domain-containing protein [Clostridium gallinarum]MBD7915637.1 hypothetical protein [Clostridium gallinarum]